MAINNIGFDLEHPIPIVEAIRNDSTLLRTIGDAGKSWALKNYSPQAVATRFIKLTT
jgi:hypothetical protein